MLYLGTDHGGFRLKQQLKRELQSHGLRFVDLGAHSRNPRDDYPLIAERVTRAVAKHKTHRGILLCRSGVGVSIAANKIQGIRAAQAADAWTAGRAKRDENANVLCLAAERLTSAKAWRIVNAWRRTPFRASQRDRRRIRQIQNIEREKS